MQEITVHILMATYQGARYLPEQLASIEAQQDVFWKLWASDDGSTDNTLDILHAFAHAYPDRVYLLKGPGQGAARNFDTLIHAVKGLEEGDLVAFCDQDDVWFPNKLLRAVRWHKRHAMLGSPCLYMARTTVTNEFLQPRHLSYKPRLLNLGNALVENVASGNTMVLNIKLLQAVRHIKPENMILHDWSTYLAVTACAGELTYETQPCLLYRQHGENVVGIKPSWKQKANRLWKLALGDYRTWGDAMEGALADLQPLLGPTTQNSVEGYIGARHETGPLKRLRYAHQAKLMRQEWPAQIALLCAVALGLF